MFQFKADGLTSNTSTQTAECQSIEECYSLFIGVTNLNSLYRLFYVPVFAGNILKYRKQFLSVT